MRTLIQSHSITAAGGHFGRELKYLGEYLGNVRTVAEYLVTQRPELGLITTVHDPWVSSRWRGRLRGRKTKYLLHCGHNETVRRVFVAKSTVRQCLRDGLITTVNFLMIHRCRIPSSALNPVHAAAFTTWKPSNEGKTFRISSP
jgi:hypothetical protein